MVDFAVIGLRSLGFVAALQAAGVPLFLALFKRVLGDATPWILALARRSAAAGLLLVLAHQLAEPARATGSFGGILDGSLQALLLSSDGGTATGVRVGGLLLVLIGALRPSRIGRQAAIAGTMLITASFAFMGHTATHDQRWLLAAMLLLHLSIIAFWFGSLWPLVLVARHEDLRTSGVVVERFSAIASWLVPIVFVAGLVLSLALVPGVAALATGYGLLLVAKVAGFSLLMGIAALNKWRFGPAISRGDTDALHGFRVSLRVEWTVIAVVVAAAAVMTSMFSPTG